MGDAHYLRTRRSRAREGADRLHPSATTRANIRRVISELPALFAATDRHGNIGDREQCAAQREFFGAPAVGEKAVMADAVEPVRQRVQAGSGG